MTPCEKLGYKVGDRFKVIGLDPSTVNEGDILVLDVDDETPAPYFKGSTHPKCKDYPNVSVALSSVVKLPDDPSCPTHYDHVIQPWEYMQAIMTQVEYRGYMRGNVLKYISRYTKKDGIKDLIKCKHYLEELIKFEEGILK